MNIILIWHYNYKFKNVHKFIRPKGRRSDFTLGSLSWVKLFVYRGQHTALWDSLIFQEMFGAQEDMWQHSHIRDYKILQILLQLHKIISIKFVIQKKNGTQQLEATVI